VLETVGIIIFIIVGWLVGWGLTAF